MLFTCFHTLAFSMYLRTRSSVRPRWHLSFAGLPPSGLVHPHLFIYAAYMKTELVISPCLEMWSGCKWSSVSWRSAAASVTRLGPSVLPGPPPLLLSLSLLLRIWERAREVEKQRAVSKRSHMHAVFSSFFLLFFFKVLLPLLCSFVQSKQSHVATAPREAQAHHFLRPSDIFREWCGKIVKGTLRL